MRIPSVKTRWYAGVLCLMLAIGAVVTIFLLHPTKPTHAVFAVDTRVSFITLAPASASEVVANTGSAKYDASNTVFSYTARYRTKNLTISEQPAPPIFGDVAGYYDKWLASFGEYASFGSAVGTVHLARSAKLSNYPVAIVSSQGTLTFVRPNGALTNDDWRRIFNTLQNVQPS